MANKQSKLLIAKPILKNPPHRDGLLKGKVLKAEHKVNLIDNNKKKGK